MDTVNLKEARNRLGALVEAARRGESVVITRRGRKVARLVPVEDRPDTLLPDFAAVRAGVKVKGKPLSQVVIEQRRKARY
jgi:prevent-host-death family protein